MLNMTAEAAAMVAARAAATDHGGFRFEGFAGHYQDYVRPPLRHSVEGFPFHIFLLMR